MPEGFLKLPSRDVLSCVIKLGIITHCPAPLLTCSEHPQQSNQHYTTSSMASKPVFVVLGATGSQGGSVIDALLPEGKYTLRAVTRDPSSDKAKALAAKGVEVVKGDVNDPESLKKAFQGAWGVFSVTAVSTEPQCDL